MHSDNLEKDTIEVAVDEAFRDKLTFGGIGTLGEKTLHRALKFYFEPDESKHEIEYLGHIADVLNEEGIIEIQTASFERLIPKLRCFLENTRVNIVFPIVQNKLICRVDTESGESFPPRKSSKHSYPCDALGQIGAIREFIPHKNLSITVVMLDAIETRYKNGKARVGRKKTEKIDCIPTKINSIIRLNNPKDYFSLLPDSLPDEFSVKDFEEQAKLCGIKRHYAIMLLLKLGVLTRDKRGGRSFVYTISKIKH